MRMSPEQYYGVEPMQETTDNIPLWVPLLLGVAMVGCFAVAIYSISRG